MVAKADDLFRTGKLLFSEPRKTSIIIGVALIAILLVSAFFYVSWRDYTQTLTAGRETSQGIAVALEEHTQRSFEAVDLVIERFAAELAGANIETWVPTQAEWEQYRALAKRLPQISSIAVIDKKGEMRLLTDQYPWPKLNVSDREFFKAHHEHGKQKFLSAPVISRANGKPIFTLGMRLADKYGNFNGVLIASLDIEYYRRFYQSLDFGKDTSIAIIRLDGKTLIREPSAVPFRVMDLSNDVLFTHHIPKSPVGTFINNSPYDKRSRIASYRASSQRGFVVVATKSIPELLAPVKQRATLGGVGLLAIVTVLLVFTRLLLKSMDREAMQKNAAIASRDFAESVLDSVSAHMAIVDRHGIIRRTNRAWRKFAEENGYQGDPSFIGTPYIAPGFESQTSNGKSISDGIRSVMERTSSAFEAEYSCHSPTEKRWFNMRVSPLQSQDYAVVIVHENVSRLKLVEEEFRKLASHDALTGLNNRRALLEIGDVEFGRARRYGDHLSVIMLDCDHFKKVNDSFGHDTGDKVLISFAETIKTNVRDSDHVGRLGGEEFIVVSPQTSMASARQLAERMRQSIAATAIDTGTEKIWCTASFGVAEMSVQVHTFSELIKVADQAMYEAKNSGRNRVMVAPSITPR